MAKFFKEKIIPQSISKKEASDTGMAMALICLLLGFYTKKIIFYEIAMPVLLINMAFPMFYYPFAMVWLGLTNLLGIVVSRILLSVVYIFFLMPVGIIRRAMGKDSLNLTGFKKNKDSVMINRDIEFTANDIKNPF
ncbi:MAG: SxtJ family membrane protein [Ferruginibacter sp.]